MNLIKFFSPKNHTKYNITNHRTRSQTKTKPLSFSTVLYNSSPPIQRTNIIFISPFSPCRPHPEPTRIHCKSPIKYTITKRRVLNHEIMARSAHQGPFTARRSQLRTPAISAHSGTYFTFYLTRRKAKIAPREKVKGSRTHVYRDRSPVYVRSIYFACL